MRIFVITVRRVPDVPSPLLLEAADLLRARGHEVTFGTPEQMLVDACGLAPAHDLYLLKSHTELALSVAAALDAQGARILNPYAVSAATQDKLLANRRLHAAEVPVPHTFVTGDWGRVAEARSRGPLVVKPVRGHRGQGVELVTHATDLAGRAEPMSPLVVQDHVPGPGEDLKVYAVGEQVWAVRKPFSSNSFSVPGRPVAVGADIRAIAHRIGEVTGLGLFGFDVIEGPGGPVVVDLNYFPGYKGCVDVAGPLAAYVEDHGARPTPSIPSLLRAREPRPLDGQPASVP